MTETATFEGPEVHERSGYPEHPEHPSDVFAARMASFTDRFVDLARRRAALDAEREARRRADTIIIELSRQVVALPAPQDAPMAVNKGSGATKTVDVGEDAVTPAASPWSRFLQWLRGSEEPR